MNKYSEFQKAISAFMLFILLIEFTGCYSTQIIPKSDITSSNSYLIRCKKASYPVYEVEIADSIFTGKIDFNKMSGGTGEKTHIYLSADSVLKFNNDIISFPVQYISRIEKKVPDAEKTKNLTTILVVVGCIGIGAGLLVLIGTVAINSAANNVVNTLNSSNGCKIM